MKKKEQQQSTGQLLPVFGTVYDLNQPIELQKAIEKAEKEKAQAKEWFEHSRSYLMRCSGLLNKLKAKKHFAVKEVCYE